MSLIELRQYEIFPGKMNDWVSLMEEEIVPFQTSKGMSILGRYRGEDDDSKYVWLREFESEEQRKSLYEAVYESDHWKDNLLPRVSKLINRETIEVTRLIPLAQTQHSRS